MKVRQACLTCRTKYNVRSEQLEADCLYHLCPKCRQRVRRAARKDTAKRASVPASSRS